MAAREASVELKRLVASATEVGLQLRRAIDARQLYAPGHPTTTQMIGGAHARLISHLATFGPLELALSSLALTVQAKPILVADRREESISHTLFLQGVRSITTFPDIPLEELTALIDLWHTVMVPGDDSDQTFSTRFWEAGLKHVRIDTVETLVEGAAEAAEVEALSQGLLSGHLPIRAVPAGTLLDDGPASEAEVRRAVARGGPSPVALSAEEVRGFRAEIDAQRNMEAERTLAALTQLTLTTSPENRPRIDAAVSGIFTALARQRRFDDISRIASHVAKARRSMPSEAPQAAILSWMLQQIATPELVNHALESLSSAEMGDAAAQALSYVPGLSAGTLIDALASAPDAAVRERLVGIIMNVIPGGELLERRIAEAAPENAEALLKLALTLPLAERARVQLKSLSSSSPSVRRAALEALKTGDAVSHASRVRPLLRDGDAGVRRAALNILVRARDAEAPQLISARLNDPTLEPAERKVLYQALGSLGGEAAGLVLRRDFSARTEPDLRAACATAMGRAGDEIARPLLDAAAKKLFVANELKEACRSALRRLDAIKASPGRPVSSDEEEP